MNWCYRQRAWKCCDKTNFHKLEGTASNKNTHRSFPFFTRHPWATSQGFAWKSFPHLHISTIFFVSYNWKQIYSTFQHVKHINSSPKIVSTVFSSGKNKDKLQVHLNRPEFHTFCPVLRHPPTAGGQVYPMLPQPAFPWLAQPCPAAGGVKWGLLEF